MSIYLSLAEAFRYPAPGRLERLEQLTLALPSGGGKFALQAFLGQVRPLKLGEWEELYTRTWDLSPLTPPYIGFQIWGEDYRRGVFLARLQRAYRETGMDACGIDAAGELPDHLVPVLAYLGAVDRPAAELVEHFHKAVEKMAAVLGKRDPANPYLDLLKWMCNLELPSAEPSRP